MKIGKNILKQKTPQEKYPVISKEILPPKINQVAQAQYQLQTSQQKLEEAKQAQQDGQASRDMGEEQLEAYIAAHEQNVEKAQEVLASHNISSSDEAQQFLKDHKGMLSPQERVALKKRGGQ